MSDRTDTKGLTLALETSITPNSISLFSGKNVLISEILPITEKTAEILLCRISKLLEANNSKVSDLKRIIVSTGPGSLTGMRVGISIAKGLANSQNIDCQELSVFEALRIFESENLTCGAISAGSKCIWKLFSREGDFEIKQGELGELLSEINSNEVSKIICNRKTLEKLIDLKIHKICIDNWASLIAQRSIQLFL